MYCKNRINAYTTIINNNFYKILPVHITEVTFLLDRCGRMPERILSWWSLFKYTW